MVRLLPCAAGAAWQIYRSNSALSFGNFESTGSLDSAGPDVPNGQTKNLRRYDGGFDERSP
jgi:hypothetical protein